MRFIACVVSSLVASASLASIPASVDDVIQPFVDQGQFSGTVLVAKDNQVLFTKGYGQSVRHHKLLNKRSTVFRLGSVSKQFTSVAVLKLHAAGKLSVQDQISKYLDVPESWKSLTIHDLLTHTGGLPRNGFPVCKDRTQFEDCLDKSSQWSRTRTVNMLFSFLKKNVPSVDSAKLGQFSYSNVGYSVLAKVIQKVAHPNDPFQGYEKFMNKMFKDAGLAQTSVDHNWSPVDGQANGYMLIEGKWYVAPGLDISNTAGMGDIRSTVDDMYKWHLALEGDSVIGANEKTLLYGKHVQHPKNPNLHYGYGWFLGMFKGKQVISHNGNVNGFISSFVRLPEDGVVWVALGNRSTIPIPKITAAVLDVLYPDKERVGSGLAIDVVPVTSLQ